LSLDGGGAASMPISYTQLPDSTYLDFNSYGSGADALSGGTPVHNFTISVALVMVPHVGTHGIRHRATTEIANSGVPVKVGMQLTAQKTVTQFMRYVHIEDDPVRAAAETVAPRRLVVLSGQQTSPQPAHNVMVVQPAKLLKAPVVKLAGFDDRQYSSTMKLGNYRPFRHRSGINRAVPPGTKRTGKARRL
jgi:hypothetical protein